MLGMACIFIFSCEMVNIYHLYRKVGLPFSATIEEFISRAGIEDILRLRFHSNNAWLSMTLGTILSTRNI